MKIVATASLWFLGVWVAYDMVAYASGLPRQITPMIALAVAIVVGKALSSDRSRASALARLPRISEVSLHKA